MQCVGGEGCHPSGMYAFSSTQVARLSWYLLEWGVGRGQVQACKGKGSNSCSGSESWPDKGRRSSCLQRCWVQMMLHEKREQQQQEVMVVGKWRLEAAIVTVDEIVQIKVE